VAAIIVVAALAFGVHKVVKDHEGTKRTQTTVLLQIQAPNRSAAASVLLGTNPATKNGVEVLVQSRVISEVCGYGSLNFGSVLALPNGAAASRQALSAMLNNITIDGSWILSEAQLTKLINVFGGVTVDVDVNVVQRTSGGGGKILIPAGSNEHLTGSQALEYALYDPTAADGAAGELTRLNRVVTAMLQALPTTPTQIGAAIRQLGSGASSTLGATRLSTVLAGLALDSRSTNALYPTDLPVTAIDAGGSTPSYRVEDSGSSGVNQLVNAQFANSVPAGANKPHASVLLLNGVGTPGLVETACPRLAAHGYLYAGSGNAGTFNNPTSSVEIQSDSDVALGDQVAHALGLPNTDVVRNPDDESVANVIVILGNDYKP
jgi:anionic cell wall polymer biosynthesis LytR-Cps2A-Psr (LCP) family protein